MKNLALHEALEAHEILTFKNLCLTKSLMMGKLVQDEELKTILSNDVESGTNFINQMKELVDGSKRQ